MSKQTNATASKQISPLQHMLQMQKHLKKKKKTLPFGLWDGDELKGFCNAFHYCTKVSTKRK